ncbi:unnamed protein product [Heligmosomoides polygyrus]|uniref:Golgin subfamily A conserved domain-containing protein n=1 Tax=Heligmosomoides polygyrus TaxID=6339 RepID=A0A3P8B053_HELPZ|nr:unnamed protein product [Heligmosomoides polygyrus]
MRLAAIRALIPRAPVSCGARESTGRQPATSVAPHSAQSCIGVEISARMHYTQLHAAYSSMNSSGLHLDVDKQIQQLQSALAVLVEEKTSLQSEMRNVKNDLLSANLKSVRGDDSKKLQTRLVECEHLLSARSIELDGLRRSEANAQAQLLAVQHERSEAQARLKVIAREKEVLESDLKQVRKDLHMKEIYLKQLSPHGMVNNFSDEGTIKALHGEWLSGMNRIDALQGQELTQHRVASQPTTADIPQANAVAFTDEDIERRINEAKWHVDAECKVSVSVCYHPFGLDVEDQIIFEREQAVSELQMRLRLLEERTAETRASGSDLLSLSEQLQNEKATVSRAVAQNRELKEQLLETEDRLVTLTEEKLQSELARQTAEHQVKELLKRIDSEVSATLRFVFCRLRLKAYAGRNEALEAVLHPPVSLEPSRSTEDSDGSERDQYDIQIRADLRRSHTRNEEMNQILRQNAEDENQNSIHVELGQAVTRIHELAAENQLLREVILDTPFVRRAQEVTVQDASHDDWARFELEKRFAQAMDSNAELRETLDSLEHINLQLQLENDTIADHVILYQHQRRLIRERLRAKDEQLAAMEADRLRTLDRCKELQRVLMDVLGRTGALKFYQNASGLLLQEYEVRGRSNSKPSNRRQKVARSYSHSTVDEFSGDEDVIVNGSNVEVTFSFCYFTIFCKEMKRILMDVFLFLYLNSSTFPTKSLGRWCGRRRRMKDCVTQSILGCATHSTSTGYRGDDLNAYLDKQWLAVASQ